MAGGAASLITGGLDGRLAWWGCAEGRRPREVAASPAAHAGGVQALASAGPASATAIIASAGEDGSVAVWEGKGGGGGKGGGPVMRLGGGGGDGAGPAWAVALTGESMVGRRGGGSSEGGDGENTAPTDPLTDPPPTTTTAPFPLLALAGHAGGVIRLWCLRTGRVRWSGRLPGGGSPGVCGVAFSPDAATGLLPPSALYAAGTGGAVVGLEARTQHPDQGLAAAGARLGGGGGAGSTALPPTVWGVHPLPGSRGLAACPCGDGQVRLIRYSRAAGGARAVGEGGHPAGVAGRFSHAATGRLSSQALTAFAWCSPGYTGLFATGGLDETVRVGVVPRAGVE